jgi:hypothetical protein
MLARDAVTLPVTPVPAFNTVVPLTTTFWSSCPVKVLPTGSLSEILLVVRTLRAVPAGIVPCAVEVPKGPEVEQAARQMQTVAIPAMNLAWIILV